MILVSWMTPSAKKRHTHTQKKERERKHVMKRIMREFVSHSENKTSINIHQVTYHVWIINLKAFLCVYFHLLVECTGTFYIILKCTKIFIYTDFKIKREVKKGMTTMGQSLRLKNTCGNKILPLGCAKIMKLFFYLSFLSYFMNIYLDAVWIISRLLQKLGRLWVKGKRSSTFKIPKRRRK